MSKAYFFVKKNGSSNNTAHKTSAVIEKIDEYDDGVLLLLFLFLYLPM